MLGGHPSLDDTIPLCHAYKKGANLVLAQKLSLTEVPGSEIPIADIDNITLQDASTIDKRITAGRMLLVGVFALAWQKKRKMKWPLLNTMASREFRPPNIILL